MLAERSKVAVVEGRHVVSRNSSSIEVNMSQIARDYFQDGHVSVEICWWICERLGSGVTEATLSGEKSDGVKKWSPMSLMDIK